MGDSRQDIARANEAGRLDIRVPAQRRGLLREAGAQLVINPEFMEPILRHTENVAEGMLLRKLRRVRDEFGPDIAEAAREGCIRALTIDSGDCVSAFQFFTDAANAAIEPALKTNTSS